MDVRKSSEAQRLIPLRIIPLTLGVFWIINLCTGCWLPYQKAKEKNLPRALWGVLDVRSVDFQKLDTLPLTGEFEFFWKSWEVGSDPIFLEGPRGWQVKLPKDLRLDFGYGGYGTYRLILLLPDTMKELGLYLPQQHTAYTLWINGKKVAWNGQIGESPDSYLGVWKPQVVSVPLTNSTIELILQVADFTMNTGGYFYPIRIGTPERVFKRHQVRFASEIMVFGMLIFVGVYSLILFSSERKIVSVFLLAFASLLFALRTVTHGEMVYNFFFSLPVETVNRIRYITLFLSPLAVWWFFYQLRVLPSFFSSPPLFNTIKIHYLKLFGLGMSIVGGILIAITLATPSRVFVPTLDVFPYYIGLISLGILFLLIREVLVQNAEGYILLVGFGFLVLTVVRDLYIASNRVWDNSFTSPFGYVVFVLSLAFVLGKRFSYLLQQQKALAEQRTEQALYLESLVEARTKELQRANDSLARAVRAATEASEAKSQFLAMMSHEIRTPMNVVVGITELLEHTALSPVQQGYVRTLKTAAEGLLVIINDILDLSRLEAGSVRIENLETDLHNLVQEVVGLFRLAVQNKGIYLRYTMDSTCPTKVLTDPTRVKQVLSNLIGNAVKFTSCGGVQIHIRALEREKTEAGRALLEFQVVDTGIGIPKDKLQTIFQSFVQADSSITRRFGGTGLGLTISKRLVELLGGTLQVSSEEGKGSTFTFTIKVQTIMPKVGDKEESVIQEIVNLPDSIGPVHILLVEDNELNQIVGRGLIESLGWSCKVVSNGFDALKYLRQTPVDLVLMDVEMPDMDGIETTGRIRSGEAGDRAKHVPIIALSAHILPEIREKTSRVGMNGYLTKPIVRKQLQKTVLAILPVNNYKNVSPLQKQRSSGILTIETREPYPYYLNENLKKEIERLVAKYNGNREFVLSLYQSFAEDITIILPKLEDALGRKDVRTLQEGSKTLQNTALLIERYDLSALLKGMRERLQEGDVSSFKEILQTLTPLLLSLREEIALLLDHQSTKTKHIGD